MSRARVRGVRPRRTLTFSKPQTVFPMRPNPMKSFLSLFIDPQDARRLYFGTIDGQMYTSADGGENWSRLEGFNRPGLLIDNLIIDPRDSKVIYAAANKFKDPGGVFQKTDGGEN